MEGLSYKTIWSSTYMRIGVFQNFKRKYRVFFLGKSFFHQNLMINTPVANCITGILKAPTKARCAQRIKRMVDKSSQVDQTENRIL